MIVFARLVINSTVALAVAEQLACTTGSAVAESADHVDHLQMAG